jgi:amino acid permease
LFNTTVLLFSGAVCFYILQDHETSSTWQAAFNAVNVLCGVGLLVTPFATATSGLASLLLLVTIGESTELISSFANLSFALRSAGYHTAYKNLLTL